MLRRFSYLAIAWLLGTATLMAQERTVQNRPYTDLRPFHFGIFVGTHLQDMELTNVGVQTITNEDGTQSVYDITADEDQWDAGLTVGVLGELRLSQYFQFRIAPAMYFGNRHLTFHNLLETDANGQPVEQHQDLKCIYISSAAELIFASPRFNNHRPYLMVGVNPMMNLSSKDNEYIKLKKYDVYAELGVGCDFYLPFFKLRPELKFMYSLINTLDKKHPDKLKDANMRPYATSVNEAHTKIIALTFYFE